MEHFKYLIVLGARIGTDEKGKMQLSPHLFMRTKSAFYFAQNNPETMLIIAGRGCVGIRYPLELDKPLLQPSDFSEKAHQIADQFPSEAAFISFWLSDVGVPFQRMRLEQKSRTTAENAIETAKIIKEIGSGRTGVLSMVYHLLRPHEDEVRANAMEAFKANFSQQGLACPEPVFTEELLVRFGSAANELEEIQKFYEKPQSGYLWDGSEICHRLVASKSLLDLQPIKKV